MGHKKKKRNPELLKERRALPSSEACSILRSTVNTPDTEIKFWRAASAVLVSYVFFEHGEAGASLLLPNIWIRTGAIDIAIALIKCGSGMAQTLLYMQHKAYSDSLIDVLLRYDRIRRSNRLTSRYYWSFLGLCFTPTARTFFGWLQLCLDTIKVSPPQQGP